MIEADVRRGAGTRTAKVKWVIVADQSLGPGLVANATACLGASVAAVFPGLVGEPVEDGSGQAHPGLPWSGCSILGGDAAKVREIRTKAMSKEGLFVADMSKHAQASRNYEEYRAAVGGGEEADLSYYAVSLVGPRNRSTSWSEASHCCGDPRGWLGVVWGSAGAPRFGCGGSASGWRGKRPRLPDRGLPAAPIGSGRFLADSPACRGLWGGLASLR
ncbi:hypothetical protein GCM10023214_00160 [Amycolatopsis dongchuanensis]|uniref:Uncharacterized protein n=2 Tax=Amycolatopsis TaxID=1813 RepID=A0A1I3ZXA6_9PSEU|nr:hypothetical protein SAMN05421835_12287 [Amycolatopsis sacchari]